jgi:hypothetical protein
MKNLAASILLQSVRDWQNPKKRPQIREFLDSILFEELCEIVELEPERIREKLISGNYDKHQLRSPYHKRGEKWPSISNGC